jgi:hypothetical protein
VLKMRDPPATTCRNIVARCHLNDPLHLCTMASDHCGLLRTPHTVQA